MVSGRMISMVVTMVTLVSSIGYASELIKGDPDAPALQTFSQPIGAHVNGPSGQALYVGARAGSQLKNFSVAGLSRGFSMFFPLSPEKVTLNGVQGAANPLFNQGIDFLAILENSALGSRVIDKPVAVSSADLTRVFLFEQSVSEDNIVLLSAQLADTQGLPTAGIVGLGASNNLIFAAVRNNAGGIFGDNGSGIAVAGIVNADKTIGDTTQSVRELQQVDMIFPAAVPTMLRAMPLDRTSSAVSIGTNLALMVVTDMHWDQGLGCLYIALEVVGDNNAASGARCIALAKLNNHEQVQGGVSITTNSLTLTPLAPDSVFTAGAANEIVGAIEANATISAYRVKTLTTSTLLHYLVVLGGNEGGPNPILRTVYALPLVNNATASNHGTLANRTAEPQNLFFGGRTRQFYDRQLTEPAIMPADILIATDAAAQVGAGPVPAGDVTDLFVHMDTVYVAVGDAGAGQKPGLFCSTALLDELGRVKAWTAWQRVAGSTEQVFAGMLDPVIGDFNLLIGTTPATVTTVRGTRWSNPMAQTPSQSLLTLIAQEFSQERGGVHSLADFSDATPGLNGVAWQVVTGLQKIAIVETGRTESIMGNDVFRPNQTAFDVDVQRFTTGEVAANLPIVGTDPKVVVMSGGELTALGAITCAEIATEPGFGYVVVGGVNGVAILTNALGNGWNMMENNFSGLALGMSFKKLGDYRFVRKLVSDQNFLYVLTDTELDRIDMAASNFATGALSVARIATRAHIPTVGERGAFLDMLVSQKLCLLATSNGLLRTGDGIDVADAMLVQPGDFGWTLVSMPQVLAPITQLIPISQTGLSTDIASTPGGMVYVLSADIGNNRARLSRLSIADASGANVVGNRTVLPLNDLFVKDSPAYLFNLNGFRNMVTTDGAMRFMTTDRDLTTAVQAQIISATARTGASLIGVDAVPISLTFGNASDIVRLVRNTASGSWVGAGDTGLFVNE